MIQRTVFETVTEKQFPPAPLVQDCFVPDMLGDTNEALLNYTFDLRAALLSCNTDKAGIRRWMGD